MIGGMIMQGIGMGLDVYGTEMAVASEREAGKYNKRLLRRQAKLTAQAMARETEQMTAQGRRMKATQAAGYAKSGAVATGDTPLLVMVEQSGAMNRDILEARRNKKIQIAGLKHQAKVVQRQANQKAIATRLAGYQRNIARGGSMFTGGMGGGGGGGQQQQQPTLLTQNYNNQNSGFNTGYNQNSGYNTYYS